MTSPLPGVGVFGTGLLTDLMVPFLREAVSIRAHFFGIQEILGQQNYLIIF